MYLTGVFLDRRRHIVRLSSQIAEHIFKLARDLLQLGIFLFGRNRFAQCLLQCEHTLRTLEWIDHQRPANHLDQLWRIDAFKLVEVPFHLVVQLALIGGLRRRANHAGKHRCADTVDVGPRPEVAVLDIQLRRRETRRVHRIQLRISAVNV